MSAVAASYQNLVGSTSPFVRLFVSCVNKTGNETMLHVSSVDRSRAHSGWNANAASSPELGGRLAASCKQSLFLPKSPHRPKSSAVLAVLACIFKKHSYSTGFVHFFSNGMFPGGKKSTRRRILVRIRCREFVPFLFISDSRETRITSGGLFTSHIIQGCVSFVLIFFRHTYHILGGYDTCTSDAKLSFPFFGLWGQPTRWPLRHVLATPVIRLVFIAHVASLEVRA